MFNAGRALAAVEYWIRDAASSTLHWSVFLRLDSQRLVHGRNAIPILDDNRPKIGYTTSQHIGEIGLCGANVLLRVYRFQHSVEQVQPRHESYRHAAAVLSIWRHDNGVHVFDEHNPDLPWVKLHSRYDSRNTTRALFDPEILPPYVEADAAT